MSLEWLYRSCGVLAALCLVLITLLIIAQTITRLFGVIIPSADDFAGYLMAASIFLALGYTLRTGGHIRVTMMIDHLPKAVARWMEVFCTAMGAFLSGYFAWYSVQMVWESYVFKEISQGYLSVPLWIPQTTMALGLIVLFIALLEELWRALRRLPPTYDQKPPSATE